MEQTTTIHEPALSERSDLAASRAWLVRFCTRLSGNPDVAEDLAQETLIEAWHSADRFGAAEPDASRAWLAGIARNVTRRWRRQEARRARTAPAADLDSLPAGNEADPEQRYLEQELHDTLRSGLEALPTASRTALIAHGLEDRPQAEIAVALGIAEPAVAARVYRGKRALKAALEAPDLREAISAFGFGFGIDVDDDAGASDASAWRETAIRCPFCGNHALRFHHDPATNCLSVHCAGTCLPRHDGCIVGRMSRLPETEHLSSPKAILTRHLLNAHTHYQTMLAERGCDCPFCGRFLPLQIGAPESAYAAGVYLSCPNCGCLDDTSLWHLALDHPEAQRFWRRHPRMRALPISEVEHEGLSVLVTGFQSRDASARIELLYSPARYEVLRIERAAATV